MFEEGSMRRLRGFAVLAAVVVAAGTFWACNERLDDPTVSEGLLTIESVDPAIVEADLDNVDPNGNFQGGPFDEEVSITIKNRPRVTTSASFSDIFIKQYSRLCTFNGGAIALVPATVQVSDTIPSGASKSVPILAVTASEKLLANPGDTWFCSVQFSGEDVAGNPVNSEVAGFSISLANR
jgi:hypothetical protein